MATDTFATRLDEAIQKERDDAARLEKFGCELGPFGQGQLPDKFRDYLHKHPKRLYIRWLSDLLAVRPDLLEAGVEECAWLIDSKYSHPKKHRYNYWLLEKSAHEAHRLQQEALGLPTVYIWPDGCTCSYVDDLPDNVLIDGTHGRSGGSGTPYWLIPKKLTRTLDDVFGKGISKREDI